ncbi:MAG: DUF2878 domain-containing protein [Gammaproteobacteria bacterium]|nr:DUF2878 domain-containing protein [Gammaproteobacteria bacterium]
MKKIVINIILFQVGWFACVLTAASSLPYFGAFISLVILGTHVFISKQYRQELRMIFIAMMIGFIWDSLLVSIGWITYQSGMVFDFMAPYWIVLMWALFAITINSSLSWMKEKLALASLFGAIAGPLAYYAGVKLGAVYFIYELNALVALSIGWAVFTPLLLKLSETGVSREKMIDGKLI